MECQPFSRRFLMASTSRRRSVFRRQSGLRRLVVAAALLCVVAVGVTASAGARSSAKPTLTIATGGVCGNYNPLNARDDVVSYLSYEPLIWSAPDGFGLRPGLATSWKVASGNKQITLTLRHDARFS